MDVKAKLKQETRSHMIFRSASLEELPKWSSARDLSHTPSSLLSNEKTVTLTPTGKAALDAFPSAKTERLETLAASLTAWDIQAYTSVIENSRRAKNYLWRTDPIAIWPDWHEGLHTSPVLTSPLPSLFEIKYEGANHTTVGSAVSRPPSRGRSTASPVLAPLPFHRDARSLSPGFSLDEDRRNTDSDFSDPGSRFGSKGHSSRLRKNMSMGSSKSGSQSPKPQYQEAGDSTPNFQPRLNRSHSDGDLTEYLKGFSNLKSSLQVAQLTCNSEIRRILEELQEHVQRSIEVARYDSMSRSFAKSSESLRGSSNGSQSSLGSLSSLKSPGGVALTPRDSEKVPVSPGGLNRFSFSTRHGAGASRDLLSIPKPLDTIYSADTSANDADKPFSFNFDFSNPPIPSFLHARSRSGGHRRAKSDSMKLALDLKLDQPPQEEDQSLFMKAISSVISVAQNILELDLNTLLTSQTHQKYIQQIQKLQQLWTENPDWQLQELVVRLMIVFASVARLVEHFEDDFRSWNNLAGDFSTSLRGSHQTLGKTRQLSQASSPRHAESPTFSSFKRHSYSSAAGADSSDPGDFDDYDDTDYSSPPRRSLPFSSLSGHRLSKGSAGRRGQRSNTSIIKDGYESRQSLSAFRAAVDEEQSLNVLMELNSQGQVSYISPGVKKVFLYSTEEILGVPNIPFLTDSTRNVFMDAISSCTKEKPTVNICIDANRSDGRSIKIECHGLANFDAESNQILTVVWVLRPVKLSRTDESPLISMALPSLGENDMIPNVDMALCNICDRSVPAIHFSNHSQACLKVHKTEMDLILLNDEIRSHKSSCDDRVELLREEIGAVRSEADDASKTTEEKEYRAKYLAYLQKLSALAAGITRCLDALIAIRIPKQDDLVSQEEELAITWKCPEQCEFLPPFQDRSQSSITDSSFVLDDGVSSMGLSLYEIGKHVQDCTDQKLAHVKKMKLELVDYLECLHTEEMLIMEIGIQTAVLSKSPELYPDTPDSKFEVQDVGGVVVKIPSLGSLQDGGAGGQKESLFFAAPPKSSPSPLQQQQMSPPSLSPAEPKKSLKRVQKQNLLRIQTDSDTEDQGVRRSSLRNPRMVVGDKSLEIEIESLLSPMASGPRRGSTALNLASSFSNLSSPSIGSPSVSGPSIKDYEIIKPISKGAFGSVFLAKKKITGLYYAIKVLRKADMVAKNQVTNIKSERTILTQLDSPYVVKLFSTFQSRNHIYLVMEYLNGGDCAALLKSMGQLDEPWAKQYITEMVQGLEFLHQRDIVHRDLKPDNMLIDINGHVKLTDFGLSKSGFLGRRAIGVGDVGGKPLGSFSSLSSEGASGASHLSGVSPFKNIINSRRDSMASVSSNDSVVLGSRMAEKLEEKHQRKLVGTPDYLAPESILGLGQGVSVDWWAVGVILYEFLYGVPPFNAASPPEVFENILMRRIDWLEGDVEISSEARQLMERLMTADVDKRLGTRGAAEVKDMPWFSGTDWIHLHDQKVYFIPTVKNIEDTDYFDSRGVQKPANLSDSDENSNASVDISKENIASPDKTVDFGEAVYKNLPLLEKANQKIMNKINQEFPDGEQWLQRRRDSLPVSALATSPAFASPVVGIPARSVSPKHFNSMINQRRDSLPMNPVVSPGPIPISPKKHRATSASTTQSLENVSPLSSDNSRGSINIPQVPPRLSSYNFTPIGVPLPGRSEASIADTSSPDDASFKKRSQAYLSSAKQTLFEIRGRDSLDSAPNSSEDQVYDSDGLSELNQGHEVPPLDVLIAESNPAAAQILETILRHLNCRCVRVKTGGDVVQCAMGEIKFDIIFCDINLPVVSGDGAARMIKSTTNVNSNTPIVALCTSESPASADFNHSIVKPVTRANVMEVLRALHLKNA
ncbi:hypothetical protein HDV03_003828 [Kappamyces sp. JEL0829]|nr:hypothetical protein HDV03_003828 [Kappamyces sp. JEL0829]